jgi:hypothetical protein
MTGNANFLAGPDKPLGRIILVPLDGIPVVHGKLVMEIVIALSDSDQCSNKVISGCVLVVKGSLSKIVSQRIHAKR